MSKEWGWWGVWCPPLLAILSHRRVAILCPLAEALGARLAEHPILLAGGAVSMGDEVALGCFGTLLESVTPLAVGLGEVQQQAGTVPADHTGALDEQGGDPLGVTHEGGEAAGGDELDHGSQVAGGGEGFSPSLESILEHRVPKSRVETLRESEEVFLGSLAVGGGRRARFEVEPMAGGYGLAGAVASVGVSRATLPLV